MQKFSFQADPNDMRANFRCFRNVGEYLCHICQSPELSDLVNDERKHSFLTLKGVMLRDDFYSWSIGPLRHNPLHISELWISGEGIEVLIKCGYLF